jgi:hypothetical protein
MPTSPDVGPELIDQHGAAQPLLIAEDVVEHGDRFGCEGGLALCGWIPLGRCQRRERDPGMSVRRS